MQSDIGALHLSEYGSIANYVQDIVDNLEGKPYRIAVNTQIFQYLAIFDVAADGTEYHTGAD